MRQLTTFDSATDANDFSEFLLSQGIVTVCEPSADSEKNITLWIVDEDHIPEALRWHTAFINNPYDPRFHGQRTHHVKKTQSTQRSSSARSPQGTPLGKLTTTIVCLCILLFIALELTIPFRSTYPKTSMTRTFSPVQKELLYDFPAAYDALEKFLMRNNAVSLQDPHNLDAEGNALFQKYITTPQWLGAYTEFLQSEQGIKPFDSVPPLFEKIRKGELWRLFTPCLLHGDIFHLLFNMLWLLVLGTQIEQRVGIKKAAALILISGIVSNTFQYLMSGPMFLGFSGVICALLGFIWIRQKNTPWEGYTLQKSSIVFIGIFVVALFVVQLLLFAAQIAGTPLPFNIAIANTAHISGGITGILLAKTNLLKAR